MKVVKTTVYKTSDGTLFENREQAEQYERVESLLAYWDNAEVDWRDVNTHRLAALALEWMDRRAAPGVEG